MDGRVGHQGLWGLKAQDGPSERERLVPATVAQALTALEAAGVPACLLRRPDESGEPGLLEIDLLAAPTERLGQVLLALDFVPVPAPGRDPHRFFLGFDEGGGRWLKLDVVTSLAYGPLQELHSLAAAGCLERSRPLDGIRQLEPSDEYWTLLLHCLLDKRAIRVDHARRLRELARSASPAGDVANEIGPLLPDGWSPDRLIRATLAADWPALVEVGRQLERRWARLHRVSTLIRRVRHRTVRRLFRITLGARPQGCRIALLGPDGAGKSTVSSGLADRFPFPVRTLYAGLYPAGARSRRVPGIGLLEKIVRLRAASIRARFHQLRGRLVVFDRYPYDAALAAEGASALTRARRRLLARSCARPDLTIVLDAPAAVLFARSGEHSVQALEAQRAQYRALESKIPLATVRTDAVLDVVLHRVTALVWSAYVRRAGGGRSTA